MQTSVRLRHRLSAFLLSWRSIALGDAPCPLLLLVILARVRASAAVASSAEYACGLKKGRDLSRAALRRG